MRLILALVVGLFALSACVDGSNSTIGDGTKVIRLGAIGERKIAFRHLDAVNAIRSARGLRAVELDPTLVAVAKNHAADMSRQNRPWHFGSDGSSPPERVSRSGFAGSFEGQNISETFEDDFSTLNAWMSDPLTSQVVLDPEANALGIGYFQESTGKIWWVQVMGDKGNAQRVPNMSDIAIPGDANNEVGS
ncbi:MAG: CAP domain-containing protein [Pseudomonadota bacterium]